ncbi:MAG: DUF1540 domain-containing protein [Longicatena sp.]|jgi:hypothetical protein|nr:DUF1540 domain-containing protein [Longicatena sp.]
MTKTEILCNVKNCAFHNNDHCSAKKISVSTNNCVEASLCQETKCGSFQMKDMMSR